MDSIILQLWRGMQNEWLIISSLDATHKEWEESERETYTKLSISIFYYFYYTLTELV